MTVEQRPAAVRVPELGEREREVLQHLAAGLSNADIGRRLYLSTDTVKTHLHRAFSKLRVQNRSEAVVRALQLGIVQVPGLRPADGPVPGGGGRWVWRPDTGAAATVELAVDDRGASMLVQAWNDGKPVGEDVAVRAHQRALRALQRLAGVAEFRGGDGR